ncbi:hypothetical protein LQV63_11630 [Paenibacillus profundus]|uniref:Uncharacterized protein n=1 Tax=Paenibacillus profundus TaxID=1173085 RepID=A0ABS8YHD6_9BACL|nr:hypothetical protein [Paenibacillus profundus]MCE5169960.1 hypothetical protein [Paenibacillus profundus]
MCDNPLLLTDEQMRKFITEGFLMLQTDLPEQFHQQLTEQLNLVYEQEGNPGNNLLPRIRELQKVFLRYLAPFHSERTRPAPVHVEI